jgi:cation/acetate symporter
MLATTWVQIIKAVLLMTATVVLSVFVLGKLGWNPIDIFDRAEAQSDDGSAYLAPGLRFTNPIDTTSLGIALLLGTAGLPHILMRFFTVPDAKAARSSVVWAVGLIGAFYVMTTFLGFGARALLGEAGTTGAVDPAGNLAAPLLAQNVGGGAGTIGGDAFLAIIAAVAFATILAVVAGLVISASGAVAHDVWSNVIRKGKDSDHEEVFVARIAAFGIGAISIAIAIIGGSDLNVSYMVGLAFAVAASANFPALLLALTWRRFNTTGAVTGVLLGTVSSVGLVLVGPDVSSNPIIELSQPAIISVPLGFLGCIVGTLLSGEESRAERGFDELHVRAETGLGAEIPVEGASLRGDGDEPAAPAREERVPVGRA